VRRGQSASRQLTDPIVANIHLLNSPLILIEAIHHLN
jgi:hypothetical protein